MKVIIRTDYIQNVFNIQLDSNLSRTLGDLKIRNTPTPFLDKLKDAGLPAEIVGEVLEKTEPEILVTN